MKFGILMGLTDFSGEDQHAARCQNGYNDEDKAGGERLIKTLQTAARNHLLMTAGVPNYLRATHESPCWSCGVNVTVTFSGRHTDTPEMLESLLSILASVVTRHRHPSASIKLQVLL